MPRLLYLDITIYHLTQRRYDEEEDYVAPPCMYPIREQSQAATNNLTSKKSSKSDTMPLTPYAYGTVYVLLPR